MDFDGCADIPFAAFDTTTVSCCSSAGYDWVRHTNGSGSSELIAERAPRAEFLLDSAGELRGASSRLLGWASQSGVERSWFSPPTVASPELPCCTERATEGRRVNRYE